MTPKTCCSKDCTCQPKPSSIIQLELQGSIEQRADRLEIEFERMADALNASVAFGKGRGAAIPELDLNLKRCEGSEWLGGRNIEQIMAAATFGRVDLTQLVDNFRQKIVAQIALPRQTRRRRRRGQESGDELDPDRFLMKIPESWSRTERVTVPATRVTVKINAALSAYQREDELAYRSAAAIALADALTLLGISVELQLIWSSNRMSDSVGQTITKVVLKKSDQPLSIADLAVSCCDIGVVRLGLLFSTARLLPGRVYDSLGYPADLPDDLREGFVVDRNVRSEGDAIVWLNAALNQFEET